MADRHEDDRGVIQDLLVQPLDSVTEITTRKGAIRGNHVHQRTVQYTYVVSGRLRVATSDGGPRELAEYGPGEMFCDAPGVAHAWQAVSDCRVLVFTRGPRSGEAYESDTQRLAVPILP